MTTTATIKICNAKDMKVTVHSMLTMVENLRSNPLHCKFCNDNLPQSYLNDLQGRLERIEENLSNELTPNCFYFNGDEPDCKVSVGYLDDTGTFTLLDYLSRDEVKALSLDYFNPLR